MQALTSANALEFMKRFGRSGDGIIQSVHYNVKQREAALQLELTDSLNGHKWMLVTFHFEDVQEFVYVKLHSTDSTVVHTVNVAEVKGSIYVDFLPKDRFPDADDFEFNAEDYRESDGMCSAKLVQWEAVELE